ncbi:MAG: MMPL family transporter [Thermoplasmata archaeon]
MADPTLRGRGPRIFAALGRWVVRHPWYPIAFWVVLLIAAVPFLPLLGSVTTNSTTSLPSSAPSSMANQELAELFPNESGGASTYLLFAAGNMTDSNAQTTILAVSAALQADPQLTYLSGISNVYSAYAAYLGGQAQITSGVVQRSIPTLLPAVNFSAALLWGPPALFLGTWQELVANGTAPASASPIAYDETSAAFANQTAALEVLRAFYYGYGGSGAGFNGTARCAQDPVTVVACTDRTVRSNVAPLVVPLFPGDRATQNVANVTLGTLGVENVTAYPSVRTTAAIVLTPTLGLPPSWIVTVWVEFPRGISSPAVATAWANATVTNSSYYAEPLPIPYSISAPFVDPARTASLIVVSFSVDDGFSVGGAKPVYDDINEINRVVPPTLAVADPSRAISFEQTGSSALDLAQQTILNESLGLVLPITVILLMGITALYFRAPITPLMAFVGLGIALVLSLGSTVLIGTFITHVDTSALTLEEVFVLGVGTDYSIFLIARYREELVGGRTSKDAVVTALTWAGQSVATSGSAAIIATLALAFSGVALLSQWGSVLSVAILITMMASLTLTPALLVLIGPRVFWPATGNRFRVEAAQQNARIAGERTYFYRAGRLTQRRPWTIVGIILLLSIPLVLVALSVPLSYDYYDQLPSSQPAVQGLQTLGAHYGPGFAFPSYALVTFSAPLLLGNQTNAGEFAEIASLTTIAQSTSGIAQVQSPVGAWGAPLSTWDNYSTVPIATQQNLHALLGSFVGTDGWTVLLTLQTSVSGLSSDAISAIQSVESSFATYQNTHSDVTRVAFGGAAPTTSDLAAQTAVATERMVIAVAIGLIIVLFVVLRSWIIPIMAVATIGLSIIWSWAITYLVLGRIFDIALFFFVPTVLFILILGLGIDYNIFLLTRVREERLRGRSSTNAAVEGVARTGGIITAAAIILAAAFATLMFGSFALLVAIGFSVAIAVVLDAMVIRTYLVPAALHILGDRVWEIRRRKPEARAPPGPAPVIPDAGRTAEPPAT